MNIYSFYEAWAMTLRYNHMDDLNKLLGGVLFAFVLWSVLFVLQGVGLYTMAKKRKISKGWLAFIPIANMYLIGKLVGDCDVFGHKVKRLGVYTTIAYALSTVVCFLVIAAELYLYAVEGTPTWRDEGANLFWTGLSGFSLTVLQFYEISSLIVSIIVLVYDIMLFLLLTGLYKKYNPRNYLFLSMLVLLVPLSPYIVIFTLRKRKAVDYEAYMRAQREEFFRRQQQYRNTYGNPQNPYGNIYTWGTPFSGNPYASEQTQTSPKPEDEPFAEFSSSNNTNSEQTQSSGGSDDFFS